MNIIFIIYLVGLFLSNLYIKKKNYLSSNYGFAHQTIVNEAAPLTGGLYLFLPLLLVSILFEMNLIFPLIGLFILGLLSDLNIFSSAKKRFLIQLFFLSLYIFLSKLEVLPTRIPTIDSLFYGTYFSLIFTIFCFMILINGSNFIDGLNGLLLGYFSLIFFCNI
jgi:UDP-N-acetylmuramyl pentapeptide phosphotransferase/UDP-N-acetylglucosamine-1-phosphate transferase